MMSRARCRVIEGFSRKVSGVCGGGKRERYFIKEGSEGLSAYNSMWDVCEVRAKPRGDKW